MVITPEPDVRLPRSVAIPARSRRHPWFASSLGKSHILYVSPEWARDRGREFDADLLVQQLVDSGIDCLELYTKDHHGNLYFPSKLGPDYGRDVVQETLRACRQRGVRFIAYVSVCFDNRAAGLHPDWQASDAVGRPRATGPFRWLCLRSPYRDLMLGQIEEVARGYDIDGLWLDILPIAWPSPYTTTAIGDASRVWMLQDLVPCYCHYCRSQFAAETGAALPLAPDRDQAIQIFEFGVRAVRTFVDETRSLLERYRPGALLTYNGAGAPGDAVDNGDIVSIEGHAPYYDRQGLIGRWAQGRGQSFEVLAAGALPTSPSGWNGFDRKPAQIVELERAVTAAHGGSTVFGHAPMPNGRSEPAQFDGLRAVGRVMFQVESALIDPQNVAEVLLGAPIKPFDAPAQWGRMLQGVDFWHGVLRGGHFLYDIGGLERDLSGYKLVILADQLAMSDPEIDAVRDYVRAGGALLATGGTSLFDGRGKQRGDFGLADVFGASAAGLSGTGFTYVMRVDPGLSEGLPGTPIVINREALRLTVTDGLSIIRSCDPERPFSEGSTLLWGYPPPDERTELALGVSHGFDRGRSLYVGVGLDGDAPAERAWGTGGLETVWAKRLAENLVRSLVPDPILVTDAPPGVEVVLNAHGDHWVLHLVNYHAGDPVHLATSGRGLTLDSIRLSLDSARVPAQNCTTRDGRAVPITQAPGRVAITVSGLGISEHVVLRPASVRER